MAKWIKADGTIEVVLPASGESFTLAELHAFVGGYIQIISLPIPDAVMYVNEDGKGLGLPYNRVATSIYLEGQGFTLDLAIKGANDFPQGKAILSDWIVGNAIIGTIAEMGG